jgi:hypothetical protein
VYDWDTNKFLGEIPQARVTYTVNAQMNEKQVSITETTFGGREELWKTGDSGQSTQEVCSGIDYGSLMYIALERAASAHPATQVMIDTYMAALGFKKNCHRRTLLQ